MNKFSPLPLYHQHKASNARARPRKPPPLFFFSSLASAFIRYIYRYIYRRQLRARAFQAISKNRILRSALYAAYGAEEFAIREFDFVLAVVARAAAYYKAPLSLSLSLFCVVSIMSAGERASVRFKYSLQVNGRAGARATVARAWAFYTVARAWWVRLIPRAVIRPCVHWY